MSHRKTCALVIFYHPTKEQINNAYRYLKFVDKLWLVDNSEKDFLMIHPSEPISGMDKIVVVQDGHNLGIGARVNFAVNMALSEGFTWMLTMDQDSCFEESVLNDYFYSLTLLEEIENVALIGVDFRRDTELLQREERATFREVNSVITSGTFMNLAAIKSAGMLNEALFIDEVDTELAYRVQVQGWKVVVRNGIRLQHTIGTMNTSYSLKGFRRVQRSTHNPVRLYYMTRNFLYVRSKYKKYFREEFKRRKSEMLTLLKNNLLFNKNRVEVVKMIVMGYRDFKRNKLGKLI